MLAVVDHMSPEPLYRQLANLLEARIRAGEFKSGQPLPSEPHLEQTYGVARGTVRRALRELAARGLVVTLPARGTFVK